MCLLHIINSHRIIGMHAVIRINSHDNWITIYFRMRKCQLNRIDIIVPLDYWQPKIDSHWNCHVSRIVQVFYALNCGVAWCGWAICAFCYFTFRRIGFSVWWVGEWMWVSNVCLSVLFVSEVLENAFLPGCWAQFENCTKTNQFPLSAQVNGHTH